MTIEVDVLSEVYQILKQYISTKDRQEASDTIMSVLVDVLDDKALKEFGSTDSYTKRSYDEYAGDAGEDEYDDEYDE